MPPRSAEKLERVRAYLADSDRSGVLLTRQFLVSWITAGIEDTVLRGADPAFLSALVTPDGAYLVTTNIEARRLEGEENPGEVGFEVVETPWYEGHFHTALDGLVDVSKLANDGSGPGDDRSDELQELRMRLTEGEQARMRELGADSCRALEDSVRTLRSGMTGREMAAELSSRLEVDGIFPFAIFAGGDKRRAQLPAPERVRGAVRARRDGGDRRGPRRPQRRRDPNGDDRRARSRARRAPSDLGGGRGRRDRGDPARQHVR